MKDFELQTHSTLKAEICFSRNRCTQQHGLWIWPVFRTASWQLTCRLTGKVAGDLLWQRAEGSAGRGHCIGHRFRTFFWPLQVTTPLDDHCVTLVMADDRCVSFKSRSQEGSIRSVKKNSWGRGKRTREHNMVYCSYMVVIVCCSCWSTFLPFAHLTLRRRLDASESCEVSGQTGPRAFRHLYEGADSWALDKKDNCNSRAAMKEWWRPELEERGLYPCSLKNA